MSSLSPSQEQDCSQCRRNDRKRDCRRERAQGVNDWRCHCRGLALQLQGQRVAVAHGLTRRAISSHDKVDPNSPMPTTLALLSTNITSDPNAEVHKLSNSEARLPFMWALLSVVRVACNTGNHQDKRVLCSCT